MQLPFDAYMSHSDQQYFGGIVHECRFIFACYCCCYCCCRSGTVHPSFSLSISSNALNHSDITTQMYDSLNPCIICGDKSTNSFATLNDVSINVTTKMFDSLIPCNISGNKSSNTPQTLSITKIGSSPR